MQPSLEQWRALDRARSRRRLGLPPHVDACLFDLDGVLTETATVHARAWKAVFDELLRQRARASGAPFVPFDEVRDYDPYVDGKPRLDGTRSFLASRGIRLPEGDPARPAADTVRGIAERKDELFLRLIHEQGVRPFPGSLRYLAAVGREGLRAAVVSSSRNCRAVVEAAGLARHFQARVDGVTAAAEHLRGKPAPDVYLAAARALGVPPARAAVFEDALAGVEAGRAGGFGCVVGIDRAGQARELREHGADVVVSDLAELLEAGP